MPHSIVLMGLMGAGKSSVGKRLSERLSLPFLDTDLLIESQQNKSVADIFLLLGEPFFRQLEANLCKQIVQGQPSVISTGGGMILNPENVLYLSQSGLMVWLDADPAILFERIQSDKNANRPLLNTQNPFETLKHLYDTRLPIYKEAADFKVRTDKQSIESICDTIIEFRKHGNICVRP